MVGLLAEKGLACSAPSFASHMQHSRQPEGKPASNPHAAAKGLQQPNANKPSLLEEHLLAYVDLRGRWAVYQA
jgi:hypothetical protein